MEGDEPDWVFVRRPNEIDVWSSSAEHTAAAPLKVLFGAPAKHWTDAAPIGNGRLGAMVWGGVQSEKLQLNDDTLWAGSPGDYTNPKAPSVLSNVRELVDKGQYVEATAAGFNLAGNPSAVYQPLGDVNLEIGDPNVAYDADTYERELDLDTAIVRVKYTLGDVQFLREHFASNPHQVIVTRLSSNISGSLSFTVSLDSKLHHDSHANNENQIVMEGSCPTKRIPPRTSLTADPKGIQFAAVLELRISDDAGMIQILDGKKLRVQGSSWAILLLAASSSFDGPFTKPSDSKKDPTSASLNALNSIKNLSYSELYSNHLDDYQKLFHRVSLQLSKSSVHAHDEESITSSYMHVKSLDASQSLVEVNGSHGQEKIMSSSCSSMEGNNRNLVSTAERVKSFKDDEDPSLLVLLFQYGRYLLISCSRPGTQPSNLQGIWSKDIEPAWDGAPHLNINLQMNYWPSLPCNLRECQEPLFEYISSLAVNGSKTAQVNYEASGWVAHQVSDIWAKTSPDRGDPVWALWQMGGAWLCTHLWEHYTYTLDKDFLEDKAYPLLEGCASFLLDWLVEGHGSYLVTNPSTSPEHRFIAPDGKPASVSYASTMDMAITREIFSSVISAAEVLGRTGDDLVERVRKAQLRLYPTRISRDGTIMEWAQDFEDPEVHHRHVSHLFGLFPGHTITLEKTPDLCKAAANSLYKRGEEGPGWSTMWKALCWAHLHDSEHAYRMVKHLIDLVDPDHEADFEGGLYSNLFTAHPPFQIDANFGFAASIAEMLVQSTQSDLYLLPALPRDKWASGCAKGLKARGGVTVNLCWNEGKLHEAGLWAENQNTLRLVHYNGTTSLIRFSAGLVYTFNGQLKCVKACCLKELFPEKEERSDKS